MAWLLIDNSNTRTKFALGDERSLSNWRQVTDTAGMDSEILTTITCDLSFSAVAVASVVPEKASLLREYFSKNYPCHFIGHLSPLGYGFDLDHPEQIGNDRLANVVALLEQHRAPGIAVDFGTAVTFSVLSAAGNFSGGAIAPGMDAMTRYLADRTAQLPAIAHTEPKSAIGKTTEEALLSGAVHGHRGMIAEIIRRLRDEIAGDPKVIATGGGAAFAVAGMTAIDAVDPDLTLEGVRRVAARVFA
ncbi:MAG: type III pantothenate kinase [Akkermansiaceae bacterium]|jgi:type III pantothenate kinase|nr:type III pantothenate kinase [Akkermansiaceae bacterium]